MEDEIIFNFKKCAICGGIMSSNRNTCCLSCAKENMKRKYKK